MNRQLVSALILFASLFGCKESEQTHQPVEAAPVKPVVVGANFAVSNLAYQLAGSDINVIYTVPDGVEPKDWADPVKVESLKNGIGKLGDKCLILLSEGDEEIPWLKGLATEGNNTAQLPFSTTALHPEAASALLDEIALLLKQHAPTAAAGIEARRAAIQEGKLKTLVTRWNALVSMDNKGVIYSLDPRINDFVKDLPITVEDTSLEALSGSQPVLTTRPLLDLANHPIQIDPGTTRTTNQNFITTVEQNLKNLEVLSSIESIPTEGYEGEIIPIIERYCIDCHDTDNEEGEVNFENFLTTQEAEINPDFWDRVYAQLDLGTMPPPEKKKQPTAKEHELFTDWISDLGDRWDRAEFGRDPGRTTLRRLNKNEYNYTVRDLFGLNLRPGAHFPEDGGGEAGFDNNADGLFLGSLLMENYVEAAGKVAQAVFANSATRNKFVLARPGPGLDEQQAARRVFNYWASLTYRRPATKSEIDNLVKIFATQRKKKKSYDAALQMSLVSILISPQFLYRSEIDKEKEGSYRISPFEVANRLSYFLWSSMPDMELFNLAKNGTLWELETIEQQVLRMLKDKRSKALSMHFAGQWFGWEKLRGEANPDPNRYPQFTMPLRIAMYKESAAYFGHLLETNASIYDLIDSDYAFLNQSLAQHYGIPGVMGPQLRKVAITDRNRGGVLGMGSVLVATSLPLRSSPAARGDYVLSEILGTPPPEPPMNVEQLPEDSQQVSKTFREALEQHRENGSCQPCHEVIDPIGFGMENYDAIGRWRTTQNKHPIDATGIMPDGTAINSPADLKAVLLSEKELFARTFIVKMLSYALGRELTPYDRPVIADLTREVIESDGQIHSAVIAIAKSYPFLNRRNEDYLPAVNPEP